ncbi:MAG: hypothetical protein QXT73_08425 [Candidatus Methanomethylicaceae archaeon]
MYDEPWDKLIIGFQKTPLIGLLANKCHGLYRKLVVPIWWFAACRDSRLSLKESLTALERIFQKIEELEPVPFYPTMYASGKVIFIKEDWTYFLFDYIVSDQTTVDPVEALVESVVLCLEQIQKIVSE